MESFSIRTFTASDGIEMAALVDDQGAPLFLPNAYATLQYRDLGASIATIDKVLRALGMTYLWASARKIDLNFLLTNGSFLSADQVEDLAFFLRLSRKEQDKEFLTAKTAPGKTNITRLEQVRGGFNSPTVLGSSISALEGGDRIRAVNNFLKFYLKRQIGALGQHPELMQSLKEASEASLSRFEALVPREVSSSEDETLEGLPEHTMQLIHEALKPESEKNPFSTEFLKLRNYLIFQIFSETGVRRSELRFVKVEDVNYATNRIDIRVSKTESRTLPISSATATAFHEFILRFWSKLPKKTRSHGYLFTTEVGVHLAKDTINLVFRQLRNKVSDIPAHAAPHAFRRTWHDRLSRKIDALPEEKRMPPEMEKQIRNRQAGWKKNSQMAERYAARSIREKADQIAEELANDISGGRLDA